MRRSGEKIFSFLASTVWCNESHWLPFISHSAFVQGWRQDLIRELDTLQCTVNSFLYRMLSVFIRITQNIFNIVKRLKFQFPLDCSSIFKYWIDFFVIIIGKYICFYQSGLWMGLWCLNKHRHPLMSWEIGQVWREVVGCRNWPVMRVPLFIGLRRNGD